MNERQIICLEFAGCVIGMVTIAYLVNKNKLKLHYDNWRKSEAKSMDARFTENNMKPVWGRSNEKDK